MIIADILANFVTNGTPYDKRFNQTIQNMLVKFVNTRKSEWNRFLDTCVFAYNTSRHKSTKFTPFEVMFNRTATLPIDIAVRKASPEEVLKLARNPVSEDNSKELIDRRNKQLEMVKDSIKAASRNEIMTRNKPNHLYFK